MKYRVKGTTLLHDGQYYPAGSEVELTPRQAKALSCVEPVVSSGAAGGKKKGGSTGAAGGKGKGDSTGAAGAGKDGGGEDPKK